MKAVLDASALLAWFGDEPGAEEVDRCVASFCSTANWSEVVQKLVSRGVALEDIQASVALLGLAFEPVTLRDAETAALLWARWRTLSLADRLCLTLGQRLKLPVLTADRAWGNEAPVVQIR